jgi:hypothetical protein
MSGECFEGTAGRTGQQCIARFPALLLLRGAQLLKKSRSYLKILGASKVTCSRFRAEDPQITRRNRTKFSGHGDPSLGIGTPL